MAKNQTYKKEIINGIEVMVLVEEVIIEDETAPVLSVDELQVQLDELQNKIVTIQEQIDKISEIPL